MKIWSSVCIGDRIACACPGVSEINIVTNISMIATFREYNIVTKTKLSSRPAEQAKGHEWVDQYKDAHVFPEVTHRVTKPNFVPGEQVSREIGGRDLRC